MAVAAPNLFRKDLASRLRPEPPEVKSREIFDMSDGNTDTVVVTSPEKALQQGTAWTSYRTGDVSHQIISSYFIGPQAENLTYFEDNIHTILEELRKARRRYFPEDGVGLVESTIKAIETDVPQNFIDENVQKSPAFRNSMDKLNNAVQKAANILGRTSMPFWSPRYEAHMSVYMLENGDS